MKSLVTALMGVAIVLGAGPACAGDVRIDLRADRGNPSTPAMGDWMHFDSVITNAGTAPVDGLVAWISLVEVTPGHEQPVDLEDWSAHKAVTGTSLAPGACLTTRWPVRLIQRGDYRVIVSATDRGDASVRSSLPLQFHVASKPAVASVRVLPVALGMPLALGGIMGLRLWRQRDIR